MAGVSQTQAALEEHSNYVAAFGHHATEQEKREREMGNWAEGTPALNYRISSPWNQG